MNVWQTTRFRLSLDQPLVMGIVNVTPDSFSDGGREASAAIRHAEQLVQEGAHILDIGGESTRPGAAPVSVQEEIARVRPVLQGVMGWGVPVSVDTRRPEVMRVALDMGVDIVNDVEALGVPGAMEVVASHPTCGVCLMHMQGQPTNMQERPQYADVVHEVKAFLSRRIEAAVAAGIARERIVLDPGIGFGKRVEDNFALIRGQSALLELGHAVLAGWSRKSSLGAVTGRGVDDRVVASVAAVLAAVSCGARIVRVHDVAPTVDGLAVWRAAGL